MTKLARLSHLALFSVGAALGAAVATVALEQTQTTKDKVEAGRPGGVAAKPPHPSEPAAARTGADAAVPHGAPADRTLDDEREIWRHQGVG